MLALSASADTPAFTRANISADESHPLPTRLPGTKYATCETGIQKDGNSRPTSGKFSRATPITTAG